nr:AzlC family ABC transporter permease [uncultured Acidaminococcus sp.]
MKQSTVPFSQPYAVPVPQLSRDRRIQALRCAFPHTLPIFAGFLFLGLTYGVYMHAAGFPFWYPMFMSFLIFSGSVEFVLVNLMVGVFDPAQVFLVSLMINARHLFYGISMLDRYKGTGWKKLYLIFGLCDETFSINYTARIPENVDRGWFMFFITFLNHMYWFLGATLGGLFGGCIRFNTQGLGFVLTAMFVVIFLEQWLKEKSHVSSLLGLGISLVMLNLAGPKHFILPALGAILSLLLLLQKNLEEKGARP